MSLLSRRCSTASLSGAFITGIAALAACVVASVPTAANTGRTKATPGANSETGRPGPLVGVVSLRQQRITIFDGTARVASSPISSGMAGHRTPKGVFSILQKNRWHESNIYSGAEMPFMQRLTWSGIALHAGHLPGYPASHGCVRLPHGFASQLFGMTRMGGRFIVTDDLPVPEAIDHERLPVPKFRNANGIATAETAGQQPGGVLIASAQAAATDVGRLLNPMQFAEVRKQTTRSRAADAAHSADDMKRIAAAAAELHREARGDRIEAEQTVAAARRAAEIQRKRLAHTEAGSEERAQAEASLWVAEEDVSATEKDLATFVRYEHEMADEAMAAALSAKEAFGERDRAEGDARIAARGLEPVSVFISRKTRRLYVRQGFEPVLEATVDFTDETAAIGTHVFTAIARDGGGKALDWSVVSVPDADFSGASTSAGAALDRIRIEPEVMAAISDRVWIGASLMISDHAPSHETGNGTDFIVLTK